MDIQFKYAAMTRPDRLYKTPSDAVRGFVEAGKNGGQFIPKFVEVLTYKRVEREGQTPGWEPIGHSLTLLTGEPGITGRGQLELPLEGGE